MAPSAEETAAAVASAEEALATAKAEHAAAVKDAPPRDPSLVIMDLLDEIVMRFGHHPRLTALLAELKAGTTRKTQ